VRDVVYFLAPADRWALLGDVGLLSAGWVPLLPSAFENWWQFGNDSTEFEWNDPIDYVDILELPSAPALPELLDKLYEDGPERASSDRLLELLGGLFELTGRKQFGQVEWLLQNANVDRLAPEFAVGMLRATANYRSSLPSWLAFRDAARSELNLRRFDANKILIGLD
jgi:hypothetical protein